MAIVEQYTESVVSLLDGAVMQPISYGQNFDPLSIEIATENMKHAMTLGLPELDVHPVREGKAIIVGAAPSVTRYIDRIKELASDPKNILFAVNDANDLLMDNGIIPHGNVLFEVAVDYKEFQRRHHPDITYYIHSFAHPTTFEHFKDKKVILWHCFSDEEEHNVLLKHFKNKHLMVGGGASTTLVKTIPICMFLGYRDLELFGFDSSFPDEDNTHFNGSPYKDFWIPFQISAQVKDGAGNIQEKRFWTLDYLARQADEFRRICEAFGWMTNIRVNGDGLLPWMHRNTYPHLYADMGETA
jgi:hypothetical protein